MSPPPSPFRLLAFAILLSVLMLFVFFEVVSLALYRLGLSPMGVFAVLAASLVGSGLNLPVARIGHRALPGGPRFTLLAVNVGGCVVPVLFSLWLLATGAAPALASLPAVAVVAAVCYMTARPLPGLGIGMPLLVAPLTAAAVALMMAGEDRAGLAYVAGTAGTLVGADILRLRDVRSLGATVASIGGAGTFDGIFLTGVLAVLLT
ncbi:MAG: DUF1614 domain-containing protein [Gammaproteobacteria bacterium]|nr:DUF1614 domain-containing protein [Gammaproteobacteria bacterium]